ncbi:MULTISPECIES: alpha/beta hydrolase [unclassified Streptomyces]|uniref:alpha/beta fold hydrolase n=1 Tax=unclassified Streptomyces TaxID=2593676 RepID=UPI00136A493E|nr:MULTISPECIES: alpha/beta hydrolase [unclassified Streptomyces]NEA02598.1 alpha/beta hydrolase [Streptomyces sp. SID10116]MYY80456.1 alpha/beta fold hydrolase [Streptomyces sp. SID335]MYZ19094.1 alpha/beta fold hydrolase [Streptomyces sp. SID337]NDZ84206.1 alpha/beta hydrolase [Streptomyces sp. SID10115]NEB44536.1 alpha/beta hydrolase [Streptomyces sp. SID339]
MSRPPTFVPPSCAAARTLRTTRGDFTVLDAVPADGVRRRGTVLLLPGFTGSKEDFIALLEPLTAAGYRAVTVDGRGQYETPGPDDVAAYAQEELARDVLAQAAALSEDERAHEGSPTRLHLLGHSLGGQIARAAVLLDPRPFATLTLMSSGPAAIAPVQQTRAKMLADALATLSMDEVWMAMRAMEPPPPQEAETGVEDGQDTDDSEALRARWLRHSPAQLIATGRQLSAEPDRVAELAALPLPKHVISGERDDTWPVPLLDDMARRLDAHRTVIHGAEHSPNTDRPAETAAALVCFWDEN